MKTSESKTKLWSMADLTGRAFYMTNDRYQSTFILTLLNEQACEIHQQHAHCGPTHWSTTSVGIALNLFKEGVWVLKEAVSHNQSGLFPIY